MLADNVAGFSADTADQEEDLRVECYVRSTVSGPIAETIAAIIERLQRLCDDGHITDYQVTQWPPERHAVAGMDDARAPTRDELVAEFERWAEQHGSTLEPAFRRKVIPSSPFGLGADEPRERMQVPLVALALYKDEPNTETETASETLFGVVPYTNRSQMGEERTYTVDEWLSAVESKRCDGGTDTTKHDQAAVLEGQP